MRICPVNFLCVVLAVAALHASKLFGQDILAKQRIDGLKGLTTVAIVLRSNPHDPAAIKEWGDLVEIGLTRIVPELQISKTTDSSSWLELSVIGGESGTVLTLSLYRWVRVIESGHDIYSAVWSDQRLLLGPRSKQGLHDFLDELLTSFAADYVRAKRT